ncbi:MAG: SMP-30/gluconolactonase/LRE family protein [Alphaproteobacteria bacterium]|nr:SMP-30/gluconolactonase/LRE family protein [Alphaproteobacteria bacterium]
MAREKRARVAPSVFAAARATPVHTPPTTTVPAVNVRVITEGLRFPEGPVVMDDGSVLVVEIEGQALTRCYPDGSVEVVAEVPGGPNGAAIGPDGACYITNNGGFEFHTLDSGLVLPGHQARTYTGGSIDRVDLKTGKVTRLYDSVNGHKLCGPNDLMFDRDGGFWFTDLGQGRAREQDRGGLYYARPDGSFITEAVHPLLTPNGCGISPDGKRVYAAESMSGRLIAFDITGEGTVAGPRGLFPGTVIACPGGNTYWDSLAIEADGSIVIATPVKGGLTRVTPDGSVIEHTPLDDFLTTNVAFGGPDMKTAYVTLSGVGQLIALDWPRPGLRLPFTA